MSRGAGGAATEQYLCDQRRLSGRGALLAAALVALMLSGICVLCPSLAYADGDPASDVLVSHSVFLPFDVKATHAQEAGLTTLLKDADSSGFQIRVAMIPSEYDLGAVGVLWQRPQTYARFLGIELSLTYTQRLLVVMPNGFGFNWPRHSTASEQALLAKVSTGGSGAAMLAATEAAIRRLAAAEGIQISAATTKASNPATSSRSATSSSSTTDSALIAIAAVLAVLAAGLAVALPPILRRRISTPDAQVLGGAAAAAPQIRQDGFNVQPAQTAQAPGGAAAAAPQRQARSPGASIGRLRWALRGSAALGVLIAVLAFLLTSSRGGVRHAAKSSAGEGPTTWPEGERPAPNFKLVDQDGHTISPAAYRGRPVIITFIDPLCRENCPLTAKVLTEAAEKLPASGRPQIIAVSVDVYADRHADLMEDFSRWSLDPQWQWAVGTPSRLAAVWRSYYAEVEVKTKHIAGTTVHFVTHSEMAYVIDGKGYERALFSWPFTPQQIDATVRSIERS